MFNRFCHIENFLTLNLTLTLMILIKLLLNMKRDITFLAERQYIWMGNLNNEASITAYSRPPLKTLIF